MDNVFLKHAKEIAQAIENRRKNDRLLNKALAELEQVKVKDMYIGVSDNLTGVKVAVHLLDYKAMLKQQITVNRGEIFDLEEQFNKL